MADADDGELPAILIRPLDERGEVVPLRADSDDGRWRDRQLDQGHDPAAQTGHGSVTARRRPIGTAVVGLLVLAVAAIVLWPAGESHRSPSFVDLGDRRFPLAGGPSDDPTLRWSDGEIVDCRGFRGAAVVGDVVVTARLTDSTFAHVVPAGFTLIGRSADAGDERWRLPFESALAELVVLDDDRLLVVSSGALSLVDATTGSIVRTLELLDGTVDTAGDALVVRASDAGELTILDQSLDERARLALGAEASYAVGTDDVAVGGAESVAVHRLVDGAVVWTVPLRQVAAIARLDDAIVVLDDRGTLSGLAPEDGTTRWQVDAEVGELRAITDDLVTVAADADSGVARAYGADGAPRWQIDAEGLVGVRGGLRALFRFDGRRLAVLDPDRGTEVAEVASRQFATLSARRVLVAEGRTIRLLDPSTGELTSTLTAGSPVCAVVPVDGGVLVGTEARLEYHR